MLKQEGWKGFPSGREKVAMEIFLSREEVEERYGLKFIEGSDSLGKAVSTYFSDDVLGSIIIVYYELNPKTTGIVMIDGDLELQLAVPRLRHVLQLNETEVDAPIFGK